jgi:hypothetical protein
MCTTLTSWIPSTISFASRATICSFTDLFFHIISFAWCLFERHVFQYQLVSINELPYTTINDPDVANSQHGSLITYSFPTSNHATTNSRRGSPTTNLTTSYPTFTSLSFFNIAPAFRPTIAKLSKLAFSTEQMGVGRKSR